MMQLILIFGIAIVVDVVVSTQSPAGFKCGQTQCSVIDYCSAFDSLCKPCLIICDERNHNDDLTLCVRDCQGKSSILFLYTNLRNIFFLLYICISIHASIYVFSRIRFGS